MALYSLLKWLSLFMRPPESCRNALRSLRKDDGNYWSLAAGILLAILFLSSMMEARMGTLKKTEGAIKRLTRPLEGKYPQVSFSGRRSEGSSLSTTSSLSHALLCQTRSILCGAPRLPPSITWTCLRSRRRSWNESIQWCGSSPWGLLPPPFRLSVAHQL